MFRKKRNYSLGFILIIFALLYWSWKRWSVLTPQPLPQQSAVKVKQNLNDGFYEQISIQGTPENGYLSADYRIWIPEDVQNVRGLIVKQHGCGNESGSRGLNHANDVQWQALALKHQFALIGTRLPAEYPMCSNKAIADRVAEASFFKAVSLLAKKTNHPEINQAPWVMWGHSGGADWGTQMLEFHPQRTIAVINVHSGGIRSTWGNSEIFNLDSDSKLASTLLQIPVLWFIGARDPYVEEAFNLPKAIFYKFNRKNTLWALAIGKNTAHGTGKTRLLAIPYLDAVITARLADNGELKPIDLNSGWLGNVASKKIFLAQKYSGDFFQKVWLPNQETAIKWQQYNTSNHILPLHKPDMPKNVMVIDSSEKKRIIRWDYTPELENGLPNFRIYRDGSLVKTLKGQSYDGGDVANSTNLVLEFKDSTASRDYTYTVAAFNQLGESISEPARSLKRHSSE